MQTTVRLLMVASLIALLQTVGATADTEYRRLPFWQGNNTRQAKPSFPPVLRHSCQMSHFPNVVSRDRGLASRNPIGSLSMLPAFGFNHRCPRSSRTGRTMFHSSSGPRIRSPFNCRAWSSRLKVP